MSNTSNNKNNSVNEILSWLRKYNKETRLLSLSEINVYLHIVNMTAGYRQSTSMILPYKLIADELVMSEITIKRTIPSLIDKQLIIKISTNRTTNTGKVGYRYKLNYSLKDFPYINTNRDKDKDKVQNNIPVYTGERLGFSK